MTINPESYIIGSVGFVVLGALAVIAWALMSPEEEDRDFENRRKKAISDIESEIKKLKKS